MFPLLVCPFEAARPLRASSGGVAIDARRRRNQKAVDSVANDVRSPGNLISIGTTGFNELYQREHFPDIYRGMASRFFPHRCTLGVLLGTALFGAVLATAILIVSYAASQLRGTAQTAWLLAGVYLAFHSYCNGLIFQLLLERRVIGVYLALWVVSALILIALHALAANEVTSEMYAERST